MDEVIVTDYEGGEPFEITKEDLTRDLSGHKNITISIDDGEAYSYVEGEISEEEIDWIFSCLQDGRKVQGTVYYDDDGNEVPQDSEYSPTEDELFCYIPKEYRTEEASITPSEESEYLRSVCRPLYEALKPLYDEHLVIDGGDFLYDDGHLKIYAVVYNENEYNFQVYVDNRLQEATDIVETLSEAMDLFAELINKYKD
jgi:hypothetical protein